MSESAVKIYARLRPPRTSNTNTNSNSNLNSYSNSSLSQHTIEAQTLSFKHQKSKETINNTKLEHQFKFDKIFDSTCSQEEIFDTVKEVVQGALEGYNGTIFAYGQVK